ncbi:1-(5-phosphoribosyl)-5-[(5-phosphoribosylamino)methylideneamino]imidazole-4-carboxamide isomerase [Hyphobacterium marinum]|uniref:1-(5-phosphoribosyl)-5-[(5-phosphoribosylamino)methylideneamino] imidazole-4-carboxamide isomerase n=1 Tax=Hyphobacterium marinum TaxID=3116574 RepID=A0ABU7LYV2_9PROT|nr:1-(5-phosphoribosyl)-5-[(5-phosphoribosylamino)methylideneamino] imidazole-4-carboxamide isomerase [Hyphobacterium sp. Y6023]MEE2566738.1 1-(5-phosphoribosyl)-5-[(5-phosphoribosylamino)methylideneamino] imidazole-4-carboxamide isomerase [Hyphobacterium sp. Y6023]
MQLYPAIDLLDGRVVRLRQGAFDAVTDYGGDPLALADAWKGQGADWLHVVDLSGARDGAQAQLDTVAGIARTGLAIQSGGGIRSERDLACLYGSGVKRAVVGSLAVIDPDRVLRWLERFGADRIALAFDVRRVEGVAYPAIRGWTETPGVTLDALLEIYSASGLRHALVTDIGRDGALNGPALDLYADLGRRYPDIAWQASGGVSSLADLRALRQAGVAGAITGRAVLDGRFSVREALVCSRGE